MFKNGKQTAQRSANRGRSSGIVSECKGASWAGLRTLLVDSSKMAETRVPNKLYATHPKNYGKGSRQCRVTGRKGGMGLIRKYGINMKRQSFRERATDMGWVKYS
ncbi:hypothetical protein THAOC_11485 [Thalassiosira oceanica]|uniref:Ribosomal protein S14 n=1 Tax=Thalassiosira oceanica TaxID=159749 RepID=K0SR34_THAOC|nr:hypothetical protein THAOC_11485 [Thalassiosira oceanica]|eukprot:EJK67474.1 hypothetical protein THAOC_11485 [Thalassiosira oceanica]